MPRWVPQVPGGPALARLPALLRVFPRRHRRGRRGEPSDRLDRGRRPDDVPVRVEHIHAVPRDGREGRGGGDGSVPARRRALTWPSVATRGLRRLIAGNERFVLGTTITTQPRKEIVEQLACRPTTFRHDPGM